MCDHSAAVFIASGVVAKGTSIRYVDPSCLSYALFSYSTWVALTLSPCLQRIGAIRVLAEGPGGSSTLYADYKLDPNHFGPASKETSPVISTSSSTIMLWGRSGFSWTVYRRWSGVLCMDTLHTYFLCFPLTLC